MNPLQWPDLDSEARITLADIFRARAAWIEDAPEQYAALLDATIELPTGG